ncbi:helix-turn-helix domain-containing protein [Jingyaoa shaoxingensis]|uniref:Helix-turn-helix domain-containing protein n=1 Tax=Jingyaoa shaoxingensis TaxID=2763671 RepID=A0ABR7NDK3_9FIRM|nr:helix-turn-helix transcriptional regulator [Jingyaoa shaoxingensis]MBC8574473.1 helix-turn-helix domain-containing protein [Jingyaoa shaoxingensis]
MLGNYKKLLTNDINQHIIAIYQQSKQERRKKARKMIVKETTERVGKYLEDNRINLSELSKISGITYSQLYNSVGNKKRVRKLRADEFLSICKALGISTEIFCDK